MVILRSIVLACVLLLCAGVIPSAAHAATGAATGATLSRVDEGRDVAQVLPESWHGIAVALDAARSQAGAGTGASPARVPVPRLLFGRTACARLLPSTLDAIPLRVAREIRLSRE